MVRCPPGVICLTPEIAFFGVILLVVIVLLISHNPMPQYVRVPTPTPAPTVISVSEGGDDRYTRAPKPERNWVEIRGIPAKYQSFGIIKTEDGQILPLYGRRTASRSDRFQYYTRTDTYNPIQLPIEYKRKNCQDDIGCTELYDRDVVRVPATGVSGEVTLYGFSGPTYVS
jgi:Family of unknown function (DUF5755)